ncbi:MAG: cupin domain-containing protein, partial [Pseudomonadota bacterium]
MAEEVGGEILQNHTDHSANTVTDDDFEQFWQSKIENGAAHNHFNHGSTDHDTIAASKNIPSRLNKSPLEKHLQRVEHKVRHRSFFSFSERVLPKTDEHSRVSLMNIKAGTKMPSHKHDGGCEMTLVLSGGYQDEFGTYNAGDFVIMDNKTLHSPGVFEDEACECLVVNMSQLKMAGRFGFLLDPFFKLIY